MLVFGKPPSSIVSNARMKNSVDIQTSFVFGYEDGQALLTCGFGSGNSHPFLPSSSALPHRCSKHVSPYRIHHLSSLCLCMCRPRFLTYPSPPSLGWRFGSSGLRSRNEINKTCWLKEAVDINHSTFLVFMLPHASRPLPHFVVSIPPTNHFYFSLLQE